MSESELSIAPRQGVQRWRLWAAVGFLLIATFIVYLPAMNGEFIWDDDAHVTKPELRSLEGLYRIWFELGATQQHYPLLHSAFWTQYWLWGENPTGYHVVNVLMHATVATLLMFVLLRLEFSRWAAFLAAGAFALHPVHVESVAWITELKNTLSGVFYMSAMLLYLKFDSLREMRRESTYPLPSSPKGGGVKLYFAAMGLFVLGLLTKTVIATLPAALLVIFWWKRGRLEWKRDGRPLLPWFVIGAAAGLFTAWVEYTYIGAQGEKFAFSAPDRLLVAGRVVWFYLGKLIWPVNLMFNYPRWEIDPGVAGQWLYPAALLGLLIGLAFLARRWRAPLAAILIFIGTLFPVLGFFNVYPFIFSFVADHFQYLASVSVITLAVGALTTWAAPASARPIVQACLFVPLIVLGVLTFRQSATYADAVTLYQTAVDRNPGSWMIHNTLGTAIWRKGELDAAVQHYQRSLELRQSNPHAHYNLGLIYRYRGELEKSRHHFEQSLHYAPQRIESHYYLGLTNIDLGRRREAAANLLRAVELKPDYAEAHYNLGLVLIELDREGEAVPHFLRAVRLKPDYVQAMNNLGVLHLRVGKFDEAIMWFSRSLEVAPDRTHVLMNLALAYHDAGRKAEALATAARAVELARSKGQDEEAAGYQAWIDEQQ